MGSKFGYCFEKDIRKIEWWCWLCKHIYGNTRPNIRSKIYQKLFKHIDFFCHYFNIPGVEIKNSQAGMAGSLKTLLEKLLKEEGLKKMREDENELFLNSISNSEKCWDPLIWSEKGEGRFPNITAIVGNVLAASSFSISSKNNPVLRKDFNFWSTTINLWLTDFVFYL